MAQNQVCPQVFIGFHLLDYTQGKKKKKVFRRQIVQILIILQLKKVTSECKVQAYLTSRKSNQNSLWHMGQPTLFSKDPSFKLWNNI